MAFRSSGGVEGQVTLSVFAIVYFQQDIECGREFAEPGKFLLLYLKGYSPQKQPIDSC